MKALSVIGIEQMDLVDLDRPSPGPGEVLLEVAYAGICGSDFPRYFDGGVHSFPQVLGHEFSGIVREVGDQASSVAIGDRVAVAPLVPCLSCEMCGSGHPSMCGSYSFIGSRQQGALAEYVVVPAINCVRLPEGMTLRQAALVEPLTIALHGLAMAARPEGGSAAVLGAGVIGLMTTAVLAHEGANPLTCVDISASKLELAKEFGATHVVLNEGKALEDHCKEVGHPRTCVEVAGFPQTQVQAVTAAAKGGGVVYVGTPHKEITFSIKEFETILRGELTVRGSWMAYSMPFPGQEWSRAVDLIASGAVDVEPLISREYTLEDGPQPFHDVRDSHGALLKVLYRVNDLEEQLS